ncbi:uncharacterized protein LOC126819117 isoform X1 [Patella vulgata]|uniref:uncharacterized protein LOC126819117 isoform X1 n=1 Tax=Patella vulgata TaxID=6465 RepID=UPI0021800E64|nr:uncharacterized protein LOC126819117 isoform X1 [Patella vulgata]
MKKTHASFLSVLKSEDNESLAVVPVVSVEYVNSDPVMSVWGTTLPNQTPRQTRHQVKSKSTTRSQERVDDCPNLVSLRGKGYEISLQHMKIADYRDEHDRSSSSPSVPYSTTDILYNGETGRSSLADDYSPKDLVYFDKDKSTRIRDGDIRRPASRNNSRRSLSLEKVSINGDKDELQPIKNSATAAKQNHFRPAGIRQSYLRGEQYHSNNSTPKINTSSHGIEKDDLVAMGTIWNPNSVAKNSMLSLNRQYSVNSVTTSSAAPIRRGPSTSRFSMGTGASRARDVEPKYTDPAIAAPASFQQRLIDLSALEAETVRWERSKKVKKKSKQDRDS